MGYEYEFDGYIKVSGEPAKEALRMISRRRLRAAVEFIAALPLDGELCGRLSRLVHEVNPGEVDFSMIDGDDERIYFNSVSHVRGEVDEFLRALGEALGADGAVFFRGEDGAKWAISWSEGRPSGGGGLTLYFSDDGLRCLNPEDLPPGWRLVREGVGP